MVHRCSSEGRSWVSGMVRAKNKPERTRARRCAVESNRGRLRKVTGRSGCGARDRRRRAGACGTRPCTDRQASRGLRLSWQEHDRLLSHRDFDRFECSAVAALVVVWQVRTVSLPHYNPRMESLVCAAILFDLDGVLVESIGSVERQWTIWAGEHGLDAQTVLPVAHGRPTIETIREFAPHISPAIDIKAEALKMEEREIADMDCVHQVPG